MADNQYPREDVFSKSVRAGKRTYFFDVKSTKGQDFYITITESKKRMGDDGAPVYEKHKIFLYREDFEKFIEGLNEAVNHVGTLPVPEKNYEPRSHANNDKAGFSDVSFDDLGSDKS
ncbi:MAG: hypothetical protein RIQ89_1289 [Bacteroidota bacterium]|jgi:hypothetical protein